MGVNVARFQYRSQLWSRHESPRTCSRDHGEDPWPPVVDRLPVLVAPRPPALLKAWREHCAAAAAAAAAPWPPPPTRDARSSRRRCRRRCRSPPPRRPARVREVLGGRRHRHHHRQWRRHHHDVVGRAGPGLAAAAPLGTSRLPWASRRADQHPRRAVGPPHGRGGWQSSPPAPATARCRGGVVRAPPHRASRGLSRGPRAAHVGPTSWWPPRRVGWPGGGRSRAVEGVRSLAP